MKKEEELMRNLSSLIKETQAGNIVWDVQCQTSEYNAPEDKVTEEADGVTWIVDECFVSYHCNVRDKEFLMITYEKISTCGEHKKSENLIFTPPLGIRLFDIDVLAPYAVSADQMLVYDAHMLWLSIMEQYRADASKVTLEVTPRVRSAYV